MNGDTTAALTTVPAPAVPQEAAAPASPLTALGLSDLYKLGKALVPTGFLPEAIKTPEQALAVMLKGQELRIPPMYALSNIAIITRKPTASAELMLALIYRDQGDGAVVFTESSATRATISYKRRGWRDRQTFSFTIEDATKAGLSTGNWVKYPHAMLRARCISAVARMAFPDTISGMYTPEEMGVDVDLETGEILAPPSLAPPPAPRTPGVVTRGATRVDADLRPINAVEVERTYSPADESKPDLEGMSRQPATPKQLQTLARMYRAAGKTPPEGWDKWTRAQAAEAIAGLVGEQPVQPPQPTRMERLRERYEALMAEALQYPDIDAIPIPEDADESTLTDLGLSLRDQINDAKARQAS